MHDRTPRPFEEGGLPESARKRVTEAARVENRLFTTTFTVPQMAVARVAGYEPIGQVMGSSIYHMGWQYYSTWGGGEVTAMTQAQRESRELALRRMEEEAAILGAHAVIGVQIRMRGFEYASDFVEFTATGTAVRVSGRASSGPPALTHLTAQELYKLELAGYWPLGIALGNCTWYDLHCDCQTDGSWFNQPLPGHNQCIVAARSHATRRFAADISRLDADGAVGVDLQRHFHNHEYEVNDASHTSFRVEVLLLGTAVKRAQAPRLTRPRLVLDLAGGGSIDLEANARAELVRK